MTITNAIHRRLLAVVVAGTLAFAACSSGSAPTGGSAPAASTVAGGCTPSASVTGTPTLADIADFQFNPSTITVARGGTVSWTNTGLATHSVTADDDSFDSCDMAGHAVFTMKFDTAGTIAFHCKFHGRMKGTITVTS